MASQKLPKASEVIIKAKKSALSRRARLEKEVLVKSVLAISSMQKSGETTCEVFLTEEEFLWGTRDVVHQLKNSGYKFSFLKKNDADVEEIPDLQISIEHLK